MTHTPGPWTAEHTKRGGRPWGLAIVSRDRQPVVEQTSGYPPLPDIEADFSLIAAAPDTLQMLKNMVEGIVAAREASHWSADQKQAWLNGLVDAARAAITKAEGK